MCAALLQARSILEAVCFVKSILLNKYILSLLSETFSYGERALLAHSVGDQYLWLILLEPSSAAIA